MKENLWRVLKEERKENRKSLEENQRDREITRKMEESTRRPKDEEHAEDFQQQYAWGTQHKRTKRGRAAVHTSRLQPEATITRTQTRRGGTSIRELTTSSRQKGISTHVYNLEIDSNQALFFSPDTLTRIHRFSRRKKPRRTSRSKKMKLVWLLRQRRETKEKKKCVKIWWGLEDFCIHGRGRTKMSEVRLMTDNDFLKLRGENYRNTEACVSTTRSLSKE